MTTMCRPLILASVLVASGFLPAQALPQTVGLQNGRISLDVVVTGKDRVPVSGLGQKDFTVKDDRSNVPIIQFQAAPFSEPVEAILVIDAVNLNFVRLADERNRVQRFLKSSESLPVPTKLAVFTDDGLKVQDGFSNNGAALSDALEHNVTGIRTTRRNTQYQEQDRFNLSIKALKELLALESTRPGRKLIYWISPGWPLLSGPEINLTGRQQDGIFRDIVSLTTQMLEARITLYNLNPLGVGEDVGRVFYYQDFLRGVTKPGHAELGDLSLQVLATQSGGLVLNSSNDLESELKECFADARAAYTITFEGRQGEAGSEYRPIEVTVDHVGLNVRTKHAYYAQP